MNPSVPGVVVVGVLCAAIGAGVGMAGYAWFGPPATVHIQPPAVDPASLMPGGGGGGGEGKKEGGPPPKGAMGKGPSPRIQLLALVNKLDQLTGTPLTLTLSAEQKKKVSESLKELSATDEVPEEVSKAKLDAMLETLQDQRPVLEAVGYRWPGEKGGFGGAPKDAPDLFKQEKNAKTIQALQDRLAK